MILPFEPFRRFPNRVLESAREERRRLTAEALADLDAGHVIDRRTVQAWADSLSTDQPLPAPR